MTTTQLKAPGRRAPRSERRTIELPSELNLASGASIPCELVENKGRLQLVVSIPPEIHHMVLLRALQGGMHFTREDFAPEPEFQHKLRLERTGIVTTYKNEKEFTPGDSQYKRRFERW